MSGLTGTQAEAIYVLPAAVTKNTFTTQAVISAPNTAARCIVPAGFFSAVPNGVGRSLYGHAFGSIANTAAATFTGVLSWDPTPGTLGSTLSAYWPILAPTAAVTSVWDLEFWITCQAIGAAGLTLQCNAKFNQSVVASGTLSTAPQEVYTRTTLTGLNAEAQAAIELWGTWSASNAANTTTVDQFVLLGLN